MKCDELKAYRFVLATENSNFGGVVYNSNYVYAQEDVDALLAKKDAAIAELKARIQLDDDEMAGFLQLEEECGGGDLRNYIAELKAENERLKKQSSCTFSDDSLRVWQLKRKIADNSEKILELQKALDVALSEVYSLLDKIESLKASHYAESVDAGMRERRLRRALYKACANWARFEAALFADEHEAEKWSKMERKGLKKAEEYK